MKKIFIPAVIGLFALSMTSCNNKGATGSFKTGADSAAYYIGYLNGQGFAQSLQSTPGDSIDVAILLSGMEDALKNKDSKLSTDDAQTFMQEYFERAAKKAADDNIKEEQDFLAKNKNDKDVVTTPSGLQYKVETMGQGAKATSPQDTVVVHYKGTTLDGKTFDSSYDRNEPAEFPLDRVIAGWTEGLQLFPEGSKFTLWIPAALAYGDRGPAEIGPNRLLRFDCELLKVKPATGVAPAAN